MTTLIRIIVTSICGLLFTSCDFDISFNQTNGNGNVIETNLEVDSYFDAIEAKSGWDVIIEKGTSQSVIAEADENLLEILDVRVSGSTLIIDTKSNKNIGKASSKKIYVTYSDQLNKFSVSSGAQIESNGVIEGEIVNIDVSSGGNFDADVMIRNIIAEVSSGGNVDLRGGAEKLEADISTGGNLDGKELKVENCIAEASTGGNIKIWTGNTLDAKATTGGVIKYWGNPKNKKIPKSYSGSIEKQ